ncbi:histone-lysine N-methyltransferase, H3 lysine-9 specific SUVH5 [Ricinus communis]|uniref:histone-lysine N-methyltransferase, H3 lysine-9 specific SUVH5 n=1 Tax=Ricinus communis TaxID=3988 RepID=UPI00201A27AB|nr:histone-lysine N-methyltransferase, H3 lysine-9 specific SUVH5 [Ricinus communis]
MKRKVSREFPSERGMPANDLGSQESKGKALRDSLNGCGKLTNTRYIGGSLDDLTNRQNSKEYIVKGGFPLLYKKQDSHPTHKDIGLTNGCEKLKFGASSKTYPSIIIGGNVNCINNELKLERVDEDCLARKQVKNTLKLYREILDKLLREVKKSRMWKPSIYQKAVTILESSCNWHIREKQVGSIDGVKIGDEFHFRAELRIVGIHHQFQKGIDFVKKNGTTLATSIVVTNRYANTFDSNVLTYLGEGGNPKVLNCRPLKDQVLKGGNLALKNSMEQNSPVRVVYQNSFEFFKSSGRYVYDGLYLVEKYWQTRGEFGKLVFKFRLRRISRQMKLTQGFATKGNDELLCNKGLFMKDISKDRENLPIAMVNTLDDERPFPFTYIVSRTYPIVPYQCISSSCDGCDCTDGCSDSEDCSCKIKNGKAFAYDYNEHIVGMKNFIYECGVSCKCFESCINRVSQRKIRLPLEVFRSEYGEWGVRSKVLISSGSFICEYVGEVINAKELIQKTSMSDYLFDIGCNEEGEAYTIDATRRGNVGRFINHSCSPNLYVRSVFYGEFNSNLPHIMLFAARDIPCLQELTYDYKYKLGEFRLNNNAFKVKKCNCQSTNCTGEFYD